MPSFAKVSSFVVGRMEPRHLVRNILSRLLFVARRRRRRQGRREAQAGTHTGNASPRAKVEPEKETFH